MLAFADVLPGNLPLVGERPVRQLPFRVEIRVAQDDGAAIHVQALEQSLVWKDAVRPAGQERDRRIVPETQVFHQPAVRVDIERAGQRPAEVHRHPVGLLVPQRHQHPLSMGHDHLRPKGVLRFCCSAARRFSAPPNRGTVEPLLYLTPNNSFALSTASAALSPYPSAPISSAKLWVTGAPPTMTFTFARRSALSRARRTSFIPSIVVVSSVEMPTICAWVSLATCTNFSGAT